MALFGDTFTIKDEGIRFLFFFFPWFIRYDAIKSVRKVKIWEVLFPRRLIYCTGSISYHVVLIETKNWIVAGSPRDPDEFIRLVSERLQL